MLRHSTCIRTLGLGEGILYTPINALSFRTLYAHTYTEIPPVFGPCYYQSDFDPHMIRQLDAIEKANMLSLHVEARARRTH